MSEEAAARQEGVKLRRWSLLCPHHRVRAALELQVTGDELTVIECSARDLAAGGRCDQRCLDALDGRPDRPEEGRA